MAYNSTWLNNIQRKLWPIDWASRFFTHGFGSCLDHVYRTVGTVSVNTLVNIYRLCVSQVSSTMGLIYWPTVGLMVVKYQLSISLISDNMWTNACVSRGVGLVMAEMLTNTWVILNHHSTGIQPILDRLLADTLVVYHWPSVFWYSDKISTEFLLTILR